MGVNVGLSVKVTDCVGVAVMVGVFVNVPGAVGLTLGVTVLV